jgi:cyclophilin family peptidyl-prolyl cis-trans isomerase
MEFSTIVVLETSQGPIEIQLDTKNAPVTTENFLKYVKDGKYDGTIFHRVIENFMVQGGGFLPDGSQVETYDSIILESGKGLSNVRGTVAMARTNEPNSATNQFFINVVDNSFLDKRPGSDGYAVFGKVVSGMEVVDKIRYVRTATKGSHEDWPEKDIIIEKAYIKS